jgi:hypothetical protein
MTATEDVDPRQAAGDLTGGQVQRALQLVDDRCRAAEALAGLRRTTGTGGSRRRA